MTLPTFKFCCMGEISSLLRVKTLPSKLHDTKVLSGKDGWVSPVPKQELEKFHCQIFFATRNGKVYES